MKVWCLVIALLMFSATIVGATASTVIDYDTFNRPDTTREQGVGTSMKLFYNYSGGTGGGEAQILGEAFITSTGIIAWSQLPYTEGRIPIEYYPSDTATMYVEIKNYASGECWPTGTGFVKAWQQPYGVYVATGMGTYMIKNSWQACDEPPFSCIDTGISCSDNTWHKFWITYNRTSGKGTVKDENAVIYDDLTFSDPNQENMPWGVFFSTAYINEWAICDGIDYLCSPEIPCVENWTAQYINESCNGTFINEIKTYADENDCGTAEELPVDNDTVSNTFFCGTGYAETYVMNDLDDIVVDGLGTAGAGFVKYLDLAITAVIAALVIAGVVSVSKMFVR